MRKHLLWSGRLLLAAGLTLVSMACRGRADSAPPGSEAQTIILISVDGFRWDYPEKADTPNLDFMIARGVRAKRLIPCFPTKTFPNHYSIVTGLYPERHGIVANNMWDPELGRFSLGNREAIRDPRWWEGEPIWVTAEKQGVRTATCFWPGSATKIKGILPTFWRPYDGDFPNEARIQELLNWLDLPAEKRPRFMTTYFSFVDDAGHRYGPDSPEVTFAIQKFDSLMGLLLDGLRTRDVLDAVNVVVVSDHGMAPISQDRVIFLDDYVDLEQEVEVVDWNPVAALFPKDSKGAGVYQKLAHAHPRLKVYRKEEIPERYRYRSHRRVPPILAVADEGWSIISHENFARSPQFVTGGNHGFDNELTSMGAFFVAAGPAFQSGLQVEPFLNIHLYNLFARILDIEPAPNDGDFEIVRGMLRAAETDGR